MPSEMKLGAKQNWGTAIFMRGQGQRELRDSVQGFNDAPLSNAESKQQGLRV